MESRRIDHQPSDMRREQDRDSSVGSAEGSHQRQFRSQSRRLHGESRSHPLVTTSDRWWLHAAREPADSELHEAAPSSPPNKRVNRSSDDHSVAFETMTVRDPSNTKTSLRDTSPNTYSRGRRTEASESPRRLWVESERGRSERTARAVTESVVGIERPGFVPTRPTISSGSVTEQRPGRDGRPAPASVHRALSVSGQPLDAASRVEMGSLLGSRFGAVRIHSGPLADRATDALDAHAFTVGNHIVVNSNVRSGVDEIERRTMAHELVHVIQQRRSDRPVVQCMQRHSTGGEPPSTTDPMEWLRQQFPALYEEVDWSQFTTQQLYHNVTGLRSLDRKVATNLCKLAGTPEQILSTAPSLVGVPRYVAIKMFSKRWNLQRIRATGPYLRTDVVNEPVALELVEADWSAEAIQKTAHFLGRLFPDTTRMIVKHGWTVDQTRTVAPSLESLSWDVGDELLRERWPPESIAAASTALKGIPAWIAKDIARQHWTVSKVQSLQSAFGRIKSMGKTTPKSKLQEIVNVLVTDPWNDVETLFYCAQHVPIFRYFEARRQGITPADIQSLIQTYGPVEANARIDSRLRAISEELTLSAEQRALSLAILNQSLKPIDRRFQRETARVTAKRIEREGDELVSSVSKPDLTRRTLVNYIWSSTRTNRPARSRQPDPNVRDLDKALSELRDAMGPLSPRRVYRTLEYANSADIPYGRLPSDSQPSITVGDVISDRAFQSSSSVTKIVSGDSENINRGIAVHLVIHARSGVPISTSGLSNPWSNDSLYKTWLESGGDAFDSDGPKPGEAEILFGRNTLFEVVTIDAKPGTSVVTAVVEERSDPTRSLTVKDAATGEIIRKP